MFDRKQAFGCVAILMLSPAIVMAQRAARYGYPSVNYQPVLPCPPAMGELYHHDSTANGNYLRGLAALTYAQGTYRLNCAQAAILAEYQLSLAIDNRLRMDAYFVEKRQRLEDGRQHELAKQRAKKEVARSPKSVPDGGLADNQFNRKTGQIAWPLVLQAVDYDADRANLNFLFRKLVSCTGRASWNATLIAEYTEKMKYNLECDSKNVNRDDYLAAKKFLNGLKREPENFKSNAIPTAVSANDSRKIVVD